ncbi:MAG: tryptophan--tRNA ligase [Chitinophagia bacterium]|nr:tryptophan--tRNA ligase [Chitinophagia bacterium]
MSKEVVLSGIRPTGFLHLGNYFGAMRNFVRMQNEFNCYFFVANWHSLTTHPDTQFLKQSVNRVIAENIACGLNPDQVALYVQSDVPEIAELYLYLNMLAYKGELEKTVTFKEKARMQPDNINAGLLTYPVLQAADILIHRAVKVPVGKDQEQNLEMARNFAERFNHRYGDVFPLPYGFNYGGELVKILGLDGEGKMSKSENQLSTLYLADDDDTIRKKIAKAKTDQGPASENSVKPDYIENLFTLMKLVSSEATVRKFQDDYNNSHEGKCLIRYGDLKKQLAEDMIAFIGPIRDKAADLQSNPDHLKKIIRQGAEKARASASETLQLVKKAVGTD